MFGSKNEKKVYPCKPQFFFIKVWFKRVYFSWTCFPDVVVGNYLQEEDAEVLRPLFTVSA